jgi:hypothetical protein
MWQRTQFLPSLQSPCVRLNLHGRLQRKGWPTLPILHAEATSAKTMGMSVLLSSVRGESVSSRQVLESLEHSSSVLKRLQAVGDCIVKPSLSAALTGDGLTSNETKSFDGKMDDSSETGEHGLHWKTAGCSSLKLAVSVLPPAVPTDHAVPGARDTGDAAFLPEAKGAGCVGFTGCAPEARSGTPATPACSGFTTCTPRLRVSDVIEFVAEEVHCGGSSAPEDKQSGQDSLNSETSSGEESRAEGQSRGTGDVVSVAWYS